MKRIALIIVLLFLPLCCAIAANPTNNQLYQTLDSLIEHQQDIIAQKEAHISHIHEGIHGLALTPEQEYTYNMRLYDEYLAFNFDSAYYYIDRNLHLPRRPGDYQHFALSAIRMAHILAVSGLFDHAYSQLSKVCADSLTNPLRVEYFNQWSEIFLYRSEMERFTPFSGQDTDSAQYYRQLVMQIAPKESFDYVSCLANYTCEKGDVDLAIEMYERYLPSLQQGTRSYSIVASTLAYFYSRMRQQEQQEHYLLLSAISDLRGAILENNSFRELSSILLERNDARRAYAYLVHASSDARRYGSRLRSMQAAQLSPLILKTYDLERTQSQRRISILLIIVSVIALLLVAAIAFVLVLLRKRHLYTQAVRNASAQIRVMNKELAQRNAEVERINQEMKESIRIKDEYIGRFLELCSTLIRRGEDRARQLYRLSRERNVTELYAQLKSQTLINDGYRLFHQNFDTAFLNIFPNFISEVNRLMVPGNEFEVGDDGMRLTTELRVLALLRLGITDNQKIADILRSSITTIYTYRSKIKSRAIDKDSFEDSIRAIATY